MEVKTHTTKPSEITRDWWLVDADGVVLGRLASEVAKRLRGKHKPTFSPHLDTGDHVIIVNASKVVLTGNKLLQKKAYRHSGYPGGLKSVTIGELIERDPRAAVEKAVRGMLPKNRIGRRQLRKLKVYAGPEHPHSAQQPQPYEITQIAQ